MSEQVKDSSKRSENSDSSPGATPSKGVKVNQLAEIVKFAWFVGHVFTLVGTIFYVTTYVKSSTGFHRFWYQLATIGIIQSFGILVYQLVSKKGVEPRQLIKDDNAQYFAWGLSLLVLRPYILLPLLPFAIFSFFHVLAYSKGYLLPAFGVSKDADAKIGQFISQNNAKSIQLASILEIYTYMWLTIRVMFIRKRSLSPWLLYSIFIKLRYEKSVFTRDYVKKLELKVDDIVSKQNNPTIKNVWIKVKEFFRRIGSFYLVNDYTKEKAN